MPITPERIVIKHSFESGAVPDINDLVAGELALNATDNVFFYRGPDGQLVSKDLDFQSSIVNYVNDTFSSSMLQSAEINNNGDLIFTYLDNSTANLGNVIGPRGEGISINGVVDYAINLPLPVDDGGGIGDVGILPESLNKTGTIFAVRLGIDPSNLFGTPPYDPGDPVLYMYNASEMDPALRWFSTGILQGPIGEPGPPGPMGEVTATNVSEVLDDLGLGLNDIVSVVGLQLSDTSAVALDSGTLGLNGSGDLVVHNGYDQGDNLPSLKTSYNENLSKGLKIFGSTVLSGTTGLTFKIGEFYIPSEWLNIPLGSGFTVSGQISLELAGSQRPPGGIFLLFGFGDFDDTDFNTMVNFVNIATLDDTLDSTLAKTVKNINLTFAIQSVTGEEVQVVISPSVSRSFTTNYKSMTPGLETVSPAEVLAEWKNGTDFFQDNLYYLQPGLPSKLKFYVLAEAGEATVNTTLDLQANLQISKMDIII